MDKLNNDRKNHVLIYEFDYRAKTCKNLYLKFIIIIENRQTIIKN